jgi:hypothetical protein
MFHKWWRILGDIGCKPLGKCNFSGITFKNGVLGAELLCSSNSQAFNDGLHPLNEYCAKHEFSIQVILRKIREKNLQDHNQFIW